MLAGYCTYRFQLAIYHLTESVVSWFVRYTTVGILRKSSVKLYWDARRRMELPQMPEL